MKAVPEYLGSFYLGAEYDLSARQLTSTTINYDTRKTTHAICVGMTGSGKTGLGIDLMEEAAIDGLPAILIDATSPTCSCNFPNCVRRISYPGLKRTRRGGPVRRRRN
jgi:spore maturation protein SpmB